MRDPLAPIPSPYGRTTRSEQYWERCRTIPPGLAADPLNGGHLSAGAVRSRSASDPRRCLASVEDELGIDRRSRRRHDPAGIPVRATTPVTAANHVPLRHFVGLKSLHGWALMQALAISPAGVLLRHFDLLDASRPPRQRHNARSALRHLSALLAGTGGGVSPMSLVCGCVVSKRVIADLSTWANPGQDTEGSAHDASLGIEVVVPTPPVTLDGSDEPARASSAVEAVVIPAEVVRLTDPSPDVIGVSLTQTSLSRLRLVLGMPTFQGP